MKANEYFRKHGYKHCKSACLQNGWLNTGFWIRLKDLVKSHEVVEQFGGLEKAMDAVINQEANSRPMSQLAQAIADVESCMEVNDGSSYEN